MAIFRTARYEIRPDAIPACQEFIRTTVAHTQAHEPGTLMYMVLQETDNPARFVHLSAYMDEAALAAHITVEPMATQIRTILQPALVGPPEFTQYTMIDAKLLEPVAQP
jgi:quinol monooxygenase YgiN